MRTRAEILDEKLKDEPDIFREIVLHAVNCNLNRRPMGDNVYIESTIDSICDKWKEAFRINPDLKNLGFDSCKDITFDKLFKENYAKEKSLKEEKERILEKAKDENMKRVEVCKECIKNDPTCGNTVVLLKMEQNRGADEPMTQYFKCIRCQKQYKVSR